MSGKCPKGQKWSKEKGKCVLRKSTKKKMKKYLSAAAASVNNK